MELGVEELVDGLLSPESFEEPSDTVKGSELVLELPPWFDEKKFKLGQKFYWDNVYGCMVSMLVGVLSVIAVPSILNVLVHTKRSSTKYTAYKRYLATILHLVAWHKHPLKPGSVSWKSLYAVRSRHLRAGLSAKSAGLNYVSQRDIALTQFGFVGFTMLKPDELGIVGYDADSWEGLNHFWQTIGYMIGLKDKYNICRNTVEDTRAVCRLLMDRVFTPCLHNVPEPFEHMAFVLVDGLWAVNPTTEPRSMMYFTRYLSEAPGYVYTEQERINFRAKLLKLRAPGAEGVDGKLLVRPSAVEGLPENDGKLFKPNDFNLLETVPVYKELSFYQKFKLHSLMYGLRFFYTTYIGRLFFNYNLYFSLWLMENFPFLAFPKFGYKRAFADLFTEGPQDDTKPMLNKDALKEQRETPWYVFWLELFGIKRL